MRYATRTYQLLESAFTAVISIALDMIPSIQGRCVDTLTVLNEHLPIMILMRASGRVALNAGVNGTVPDTLTFPCTVKLWANSNWKGCQLAIKPQDYYGYKTQNGC